jgi:hypothetical protein
MTALSWDAIGERFYETGVDHGVLYIPDVTGVYSEGVAWNGLVTVTESPSGAEPTALYADNIKYLNLYSAEEFGATIEAFTYPEEFAQFDGLSSPEAGVYVGQQPRRSFGLAYRTQIGNDLEGSDHAYRLHLMYGCQASPSEKAYGTINDSPEAITFSWEVSTTPAPVTGMKPTSLITIDSRTADATALAALEDELFGSVGGDPNLPSPDEVLAYFTAASLTEAVPTSPTFVSGTGVITIPSVTGVVYRRADTNAVVPSGAMAAIPAGSTLVIRANPATGYYLDPDVDDDWSFTRP